MKVKNCVSAEFNSICSFVLYSSIFTLCGWQACQWHDKNTAETVLFFDRLFDSVNGAGSAKGARGKLRTAVTKKW
ncbi:uncharacterized protein LOC135117227 isoform X2 [Helicoverpa armigera]|uniref:uncharacterized protein LOC135117227 isoform X2 n=1 Tax=Helicoverpa armigera TaxID=29058 RepID=UPI0030828619